MYALYIYLEYHIKTNFLYISSGFFSIFNIYICNRSYGGVIKKNNKREEKFLLSGNNNIETGILFSI